MRVLLTSAGLETTEIQNYFMKMINKEMTSVKALFIPVAAINAGAIAVLPKCMNDLLQRVNETSFNEVLIDTQLDVHCSMGDALGKVEIPLKNNIRLTDKSALAIHQIPENLEIIG